ADLAEGEKLGVAGTPTFFVNGRAHAGMTTLDEFKTLVQNAHLRAMTLAEVTDAMMSKGPADAPVVLEVFADYQSAVSPPAFEAVNRLMELYPSQVRLQFRDRKS